MGIKDFFKIAVGNSTIEKMGVKTSLASLNGQIVGVDAFYFIYNAITANKSLCDSNGRYTAHLNTILMKVLLFNKHNISQVWIFDNMQKNPDKVLAYERRANSEFKITEDIINQTMDLLTYLGIMHIVVPPGIEAEQYGARLCMDDGFISYFVSGDSDVLVFGGNLLRPRKEKNSTVYYIYNCDTLLSELNINREELAKIAVIMGNDFCEKTKGIGPKTVLKKKDTKLTACQSKVVEKYIAKLDKQELSNASTYKSEPNNDAVINFLKKFDFSEERLKKILK